MSDVVWDTVGMGEVGRKEMKMNKKDLTLKNLKENGEVAPLTSALIVVRVQSERETTPIIWEERI